MGYTAAITYGYRAQRSSVERKPLRWQELSPIHPRGTVLATGAKTLTATFTPTDTVDYSPAHSFRNAEGEPDHADIAWARLRQLPTAPR